MIEIHREAFVDRAGSHLFSVRLLQEFGRQDGYLDAEKIRDLWVIAKEHPVIFTDEVEGDFERFLEVLTDPLTVWFEIFDEINNKPVGVYSLSNVYVGYDAVGHFGFWDRLAAGRERLTWKMMLKVFDKYNLHRMTAEIPAYSTGTIRTVERLGFKQEGLKRQAARRKGTWKDLVILGILREELEEVSNGTAKTA